ncbi:UDP-2,3-diacylglucosamine diphosphatase [Shewanella sp. WXL01]|uniref:UDP-2,3-diacylglucosamine diphosphatase n=1 Tax=Shewanella sp. WXL01 TaxID=2709721 RepID=UPI0014384A14|nr:UDP-2,3-diacylglucosamine diphosphatase [Shewanella sp. WXL01]
MSTVFIGDLHLSEDRHDISNAFIHFLQSGLDDVDSLYIIGDLFEVWVGDDIAPPFALDIARHIAAAAKKTPVYFIHGNRDFMLGKQYCKLADMQILPEVHKISLYGKPTVVLHGDSLCTLDKAYQRFRKFRSIGLFRWLYACLPKQKRLNIAANIRGKSVKDNQRKSYQIMDVEQSAVDALFANTDSVQMIHGHTHRPNIHTQADGNCRIVVGDWYDQGSVLVVDEAGAKLQNLPLMPA